MHVFHNVIDQLLVFSFFGFYFCFFCSVSTNLFPRDHPYNDVKLVSCYFLKHLIFCYLVAHRVVKQHSHFLDGATLDVNFELLDTEASGKIIEITGLSTNSSEDSVWNYFENKRNGGGEVETVDFRPARGVAFVTFKDAHGR